MRDYGGFGDPELAKTALLIECGQHWERRSAEIATYVTLRFLIRARQRDQGGRSPRWPPWILLRILRQRVIEVTEAVTITGERFDFA